MVLYLFSWFYVISDRRHMISHGSFKYARHKGAPDHWQKELRLVFPASKLPPLEIVSAYSYRSWVFLWLPRCVFPAFKLPGIPIGSEVFLWLSSLPMAAQVGITTLQVIRYFCRFRSIPMDSYILLWLPKWIFPSSKVSGIPVNSEAFLWLGSIPMAAKVCLPASKLSGIPIDSEVFLWIPTYVYGYPGGYSQPPSYQVFP